ncbi:MAG: NADH-quinone oxidoreductase subunit NuoG [Candidatus Eisenbacteria bacterium]|uniref:NADH-quinone oxidoreductase n=1 Tax=Eiseniibacteriota bacterium TaxID=2212470 RepID=A0A538TJ73_UNCEI|nr:MAG: NADH-quinone oxidoreductase subunit NuoG [Candidatus Eisenbacteria bacterium]
MSGPCKVTINGRTIEVPAGTLVTEAARRAGVHVPIFCSHDKLPPLGACRICVVEIGMPKLGPDRLPVMGTDGKPEISWMPKPQTGCTTTVAEGMHVLTESPGAVKARKGVMEFLLVNHPLDCPVCDEGGECQLQDLAFAFGHDFSRMDEAKRTFDSEDLGPVVKKEANRCIVCMRCVRYCDEIMGDDALTAHQRGVWTEISSFNRQPLECEQCGNCIEVCPVGALTALPYRFKARPWDLRQHVTVCPYCSNGCSVRLGVRGAEVLRARGTEARGVNREYLCVRGRFGYEFVNSAERLSAPLVRLAAALEPSTHDEAVTFAASRLREIAAVHGAASIAFLGGEKLTVEEAYLFQKLARAALGTNHVDSRTRWPAPVSGRAVFEATGGGRAPLTFDDLVAAQEVLVLGEDLQGEAPFAQAQLIRGQHQKGLHLTIAHPRRVKLADTKFRGEWLAYRPHAEVALLHGLARATLDLGSPAGLPADGLAELTRSLAAWSPERVEQETGVAFDSIAAAAQRLKAAERKALLFGRALTEHPQAAALLAAVESLAWLSGALGPERSAVMYLGPQNDTQGALDMGLAPDCLPGYVPVTDTERRRGFEQAWGGPLPGAPGKTAVEILESAAKGEIRALWIVSDNWIRSAPDRRLAEEALGRAELVIVNDMFLTETARKAHVVFPVASFAEKEGVVVNCERRLQKTVRALTPRKGTRGDGEIFQAVARALGARWSYRSTEDVFREIARLVPGYRGISWANLLPLGTPWVSEDRGQPRLAPVTPEAAPAGEGLAVLGGGILFLQGSLSHRTALLPKLAKAPRAVLHPEEAKRLAVADGERIELEGPGGTIRVAVSLDARVPEGSVFVPYAHAEIELNRLGKPSAPGLKCQARRVSSPERIGAG